MVDFSKFSWSSNPFTLKIDHALFTGYTDQLTASQSHVEEKQKIALITGSTGAGKTTLLKYLQSTLPHKSIYISKPPENPEDFVGIFSDNLAGFFEKLSGRKPTLFNLPSYINKKLGKKQLVILLDEAHETNREVLEWLRVLTDQIENVSLIIAGMPVLEIKIKTELETLDQRITTRISLNSLLEQETKELIQKRIKEVGGEGIIPFTDGAVSAIYNKTGGFPREVLKTCDKLVKSAIKNETSQINEDFVKDYKEFSNGVKALAPLFQDIRPETPLDRPVQRPFETPSVTFVPKPAEQAQISNLPYKQRKVLEALSKEDWLTPTAIAESLEFKYPSRGHAIRSLNNILRRLQLDGFVQRESRGKAYMYALSPKTKTLMAEK